jgi:hypothetical protein
VKVKFPRGFYGEAEGDKGNTFSNYYTDLTMGAGLNRVTGSAYGLEREFMKTHSKITVLV